jgi:hypothetical protein
MTESIAVCNLIKNYFYDPTPEELAENCIRKSKPGDFYFGLTKELILKCWNEKKEEGLKTHKEIETNFENSVVYDYIYPYIEKGYQKFDEMNINLYTKKYNIKGKADCVLINHNSQCIIICEWKNCKYYFLKSDLKGFGPCSNLYNTKFTKHLLQSEFYKALLKSKYPDYLIDTRVIYICDKKIEKIIQPTFYISLAVETIINDLNK